MVRKQCVVTPAPIVTISIQPQENTLMTSVASLTPQELFNIKPETSGISKIGYDPLADSMVRKQCVVTPAPIATTSIQPQENTLMTSVASLTPQELFNIKPETSGISKIGYANPVTTAGKRNQLLQMFCTSLVPVVLLSIFTGVLFGSHITDYKEKSAIRRTINLGVSIAELVYNLDLERDMTALYLSDISPDSKAFLLKRYQKTDAALQSIKDWQFGITLSDDMFKDKDKFTNYIFYHRYHVDIGDVTVSSELKFYTKIVDTLIQWFFDSISEASSGSVWKELVALQEIMRATQSAGLERAYGTIFFTHGGFESQQAYLTFMEAQDVANFTLSQAMEYSDEIIQIYNEFVKEDEEFLSEINHKRLFIRKNGLKHFPDNKTEADLWFNSMSHYLESLFQMQRALINQTAVIQEDKQSEQLRVLVILASIFCLVLVLCPVTLLHIYQLTRDMQAYSSSLIDRTQALNKEKKRTDSLLYQLLPKSVAERLKKNEKVMAESFEQVTIFFSDIVDFTKIAGISSPIQVVEMLNDLYLTFDARINLYDVYKVETIGDACMVVSGMPNRNGNFHSAEICSLALDIMDHIKTKPILHMPNTHIQLRIGVHTGPIVAAVVGKKMPRYSVFGETVNIAERMEATAPSGEIQISKETKDALDIIGGFVMQPRVDPPEDISVKTFILIHRLGMHRLCHSDSSSSGSRLASPTGLLDEI